MKNHSVTFRARNTDLKLQQEGFELDLIKIHSSSRTVEYLA